jgi:hypothetical protein
MANYSLSEIEALCRKASRGAGYSWGLAEDTGKAVRWLTAYGLPGSEVLAELLQKVAGDLKSFIPELNGDGCNNQKNALCPLYCGAIVNDLGHWVAQDRTLTFHSMLYPLLVLPQAARIAEAFKMPVTLSFADIDIVCTSHDISFYGEPFWEVKSGDSVCQRASIDAAVKANKLFPSPLSRPVSAEAIKILESYAHKTYAPATEASRLAGAGAGLSDND